MKNYKFLLPLVSYYLFVILWISAGYFSIGAITDTYSDVFSALNSTFWEKFTNASPYIDIHRYRPFTFIFLQVITFISSILGSPPNNFLLLKIIMLILFFFVGFVSYLIVFRLNTNNQAALVVFIFIIAYPNNLHSLFWTAGVLELLLTVLFLLAILFKIYFLQTGKVKYHILSTTFLIFSLFTKETALIYPFISLILLRANFTKEFLSKYRWSFVNDFLVVVFFVIFRSVVVLLRTNSLFKGTVLNSLFPFITFFDVLFKAAFSVVFPFDYLKFLHEVSMFNLYVIVYVTTIILLFLVLLCRNNKKALLFSGVVFLVSIFPFLFAGYVRPQLILLPFCLLTITFGAKIIKIPATLLIIILTFWVFWGIAAELNWKFAYGEAQKNLNLLSSIDTDDKSIVLIGTPSRLQQYYISDNVMFPFNLKKYGQYIIRDTIIDNLRVVYLSKEAINKGFIVTRKTENSFILLCANQDQFFYLPDKNTLKQNEILENEFFKITVIGYNLYSKPSQILLEIKKTNIGYYLVQPNRIINLKDL